MSASARLPVQRKPSFSHDKLVKRTLAKTTPLFVQARAPLRASRPRHSGPFREPAAPISYIIYCIPYCVIIH